MENPAYLGTPESASALVDAVHWIQLILTGRVATIVSTLAIATIGFMMLSGRTPLARGATVILGCFVLFAASTIADALMNAVQPASSEVVTAPVMQSVSPPPSPSKAYDPYAGASVPYKSTESHDLLQN